MSWRRKFSAMAMALAGVVGLVLLEVGGLLHYRAAARKADKELDRSRRELRSLSAVEPAPTRENAVLIEADVGRVSETLTIVERELLAAGVVADRFARAPVPIRRPEAFFDIAAFVEGLRTRARQAGVAIKPEERFGLSAYNHEAPASGQIAGVFRERQAVQYLVETLIEAKPHELLAVQRERPSSETGARIAPGAAAAPSRRPATTGSDADYFTIDPRLSARRAGGLVTRAFRLSFTGHTATLRTFLNKLAAFELPLVVRAVEVASPERSLERIPAGDSPVVVAPWWSQFVVTVELLDLPRPPSSPS